MDEVINGMRPVHPGEIPAPRINDIVREKRGITADTALRLARYFGTSAEFWLGLQDDYDLKTCREQLHDTLDRIVPRATV